MISVARRAEGYVINVAGPQRRWLRRWTHIDGWSEAVIDYIAELESASAPGPDSAA